MRAARKDLGGSDPKYLNFRREKGLVPFVAVMAQSAAAPQPLTSASATTICSASKRAGSQPSNGLNGMHRVAGRTVVITGANQQRREGYAAAGGDHRPEWAKGPQARNR